MSWPLSQYPQLFESRLLWKVFIIRAEWWGKKHQCAIKAALKLLMEENGCWAAETRRWPYGYGYRAILTVSKRRLSDHAHKEFRSDISDYKVVQHHIIYTPADSQRRWGHSHAELASEERTWAQAHENHMFVHTWRERSVHFFWLVHLSRRRAHIHARSSTLEARVGGADQRECG